MKDIIKKVIIILVFSSIVIQTIPVYPIDESNQELSSRVSYLTQKINEYIPNEVSYETDENLQPTLSNYIRYGLYLRYVSELEQLVTKNGENVHELVIEALDEYKEKIDEFKGKFNNISSEEEVYLYVKNEAQKKINNVLVEITSKSDSETSRLFGVYLENLRAYLKNWSSALVYLSEMENSTITEEELKTYESEFNKAYEAILNTANSLGLSLNLTFTRTGAENYVEAPSISQEIINEDGTFKPWYLEVFALSAKTEGKPLEEYKNYLSTPAKEFFEKYKDLRLPLYVANDADPVAAFYKNKTVSLKLSNLGDFLSNKESATVFYFPVYENEEELPEDEKEVKETDLSKDNDFMAIYVKEGFSKQRAQSKMDPNSINSFAGSANMNYLQFTNYYESGKTNQLFLDSAYPLYIDIWGNIQTQSGHIIIPGVSNANLTTKPEYFPLNAYFMNNYPVKSIETMLNDKIIDKSKYLIYLTGGDLTVENLGLVQNNTVMTKLPFFYMSKYKTTLFGSAKEKQVSWFDKLTNSSGQLPTIITYVENELDDGSTEYKPFLMEQAGKERILSTQMTALVLDGKTVPFSSVNDNIPVEKWTYNYYYGKDGDRGRLRNKVLVTLANSIKFNPDSTNRLVKARDSQPMSRGYKWGTILEPLHLMLSKVVKNYIIYTPAISELPGINTYLSVFFIPIIKLFLLVSVLFIILRYLKYIKSASLTNLALSIMIVYLANLGITKFYPALLNTSFNGAVSLALGNKTMDLTLYNIEKDLNDQPEFYYSDNVKLISPGSYIKLASIDPEEVKAYRATEEEAPWKNSDYYIPQWDNTLGEVGTLFLKGTDLNIYVKDLFASCRIIYQDGEYKLAWETAPQYTYYTPYLSILEGLVESVNKYSKGKVTPKILEYSNGYEAESGAALTYFTSPYFIVDDESAANAGEEFKKKWEEYNGGDYLHLQEVLYIKDNISNFPQRTEANFAIKTTRWYKTAMGNREQNDILRRIKNVNLNTKEYIYSILPYLDNITDETALKLIALKATIEFNKEFSKSPVERLYAIREWVLGILNKSPNRDYYLDIYPKRLELDYISVDEFLKLGLIDTNDLLKFNITGLYRFVENQTGFFGLILLSLNVGLVYSRCILRIAFITVIVFVVILYMVVVYALRRDYSNKSIIGMIGVIATSWVVYFIDNLIFIMFSSVSKKEPGMLFLILIIWIFWNVVATSIYISLFTVIWRDISNFGGEIMFSAMSKTLNFANAITKKLVGTISKSRAEYIDLTRPDWEMKAEKLNEYMSKDIDEKIRESYDDMSQILKGGIDSTFDRINLLKNMKSISQIYADNKDNPYITVKAYGVPEPIQEYLKSRNIKINKGKGFRVDLEGKNEDWKRIVEENKVVSEPFSKFLEKDSGFYMPTSSFWIDNLTKSGIFHEVLDNTIWVPKTEGSKLAELSEKMISPVYRIKGDRTSILDKIEGELPSNQYFVGKNGIYLKNKSDAEKIFGPSNYEEMYQTIHKTIDRIDTTVDGGSIVKNLDFLNGTMMTDEYIYGNLSKRTLSKVLSEGITIVPTGKGVYKFDLSNRDRLKELISESVRYTVGEDVMFRDRSPINKLFTWEGEDPDIDFSKNPFEDLNWDDWNSEDSGEEETVVGGSTVEKEVAATLDSGESEELPLFDEETAIKEKLSIDDDNLSIDLDIEE